MIRGVVNIFQFKWFSLIISFLVGFFFSGWIHKNIQLRHEVLRVRESTTPAMMQLSSFDSTTGVSGINNNGGGQSILDGVKILVCIAAFDFSQTPHLEEVLDGYHDLCVAGAYVNIVIHATIPYTVALIDLLNTRLNCVNSSPNAGLDVQIAVKNPNLRLNLVDGHRTLFYDKIEDFDLFIYSEVSNLQYVVLDTPE